jgi:hypothetical protein
MASVSWQYPQDQLIALRRKNAAALAAQPVATGVDISALNFRYDIEGDTPAWRPLRAFDDGAKVYIEFPSGIRQGEIRPSLLLDRAAIPSSSTTAPARTTTSSIASLPPPSSVSGTRTASGACALCAPTEGGGYDRWNAESAGGHAGPAAARGAAARHAPLAQGADWSWRCGRPRRRRGADLRAATRRAIKAESSAPPEPHGR